MFTMDQNLAGSSRPSPSVSRRTTVIAGCGGIAHAHVEAARAHADRLDLSAAMDVDEVKAKEFCAKYDIPQYYTSFEKMLAATEPALVQIATPPQLHVPMSIQAMEAGAWVWCEKPLCSSLAELDILQEAECRTGRYTACVFQNRYSSGAKHVKRLINEGLLGAGRLAICHTLWYRHASYFAAPWRGKWKTALGGVTTNHGIHAMDLLLYLLGPWNSLRAEAATLAHPIEVEDVSAAIVRFESGVLASIVNSVVSPRQETYLRLDFEHATVECSYLYDCANENWRFFTLDGGEALSVDSLRQIPANVPNSHTAQLTDLLDDMDHHRRPGTSGDEARYTLEFLHAMYKSAFTGDSVEKGSILPKDPFYQSFHAMKCIVN